MRQNYIREGLASLLLAGGLTVTLMAEKAYADGEGKMSTWALKVLSRNIKDPKARQSTRDIIDLMDISIDNSDRKELLDAVKERKREQTIESGLTRKLPPTHVLLNSKGEYKVEQGYTWVNPDNNNDLSVKKIGITVDRAQRPRRLADTSKRNKFFTCMGRYDKGEPGFNYPDEFKNLGKEYWCDFEKITFSAILINEKNSILTFKLFDKEGKITKKRGATMIKSHNYNINYYFDEFELKKGEYTGAWYLDGNTTPVGMVDVEVLDPSLDLRPEHPLMIKRAKVLATKNKK